MADMLARHDRALRLIETQLAMDLQLDDAAAGLPATSPAGTPGTVLPGSTIPAATAPSTPASTTVTTPPSAPVDPGKVDMAQALYDSGMTAFNDRRYDQALKAFTDFTGAYPQHKLVSNAWFWQGECNYQMKNYAAAALAYEKVISGFPNSKKAPASYLKQGMSFLQLGKKDAARERLNQLIAKYPKAPEATRARHRVVGSISRVIRAERAFLRAGLEQLGLYVCPSQANYLLFYSPLPLKDALLERGILVRDCSNYRGLDAGWYRIAVRRHEENQTLLSALSALRKEA